MVEMDYAINEAMMEFAKTVQYLIERGWTLGELKYGERKFGIGTSLTLSKGEKSVQCYSSSDMEGVLQDEINEEIERQWKK